MKKLTILLTILMFSLVVAQSNMSNNSQNNAGLQNAAQSVLQGSDNASNNSQQVRARVAEMLQERAQIRELLRNQSRIKINISNKEVEFEKQAEKIKMKANGVEADTNMNITHNQSKLLARLSNGKHARIRIMPDAASQQALEQLQLRVCSAENNCSIQLRETGQGNQTRAAYHVRAEKQARILGIFPTKMQVQAEVDAETGQSEVKKPWWAFLASESDE
ncbi:MAG: hypothetical protein ACP5D2_04460 [Candidatus Nanoarchaeia archaeon]